MNVKKKKQKTESYTIDTKIFLTPYMVFVPNLSFNIVTSETLLSSSSSLYACVVSSVSYYICVHTIFTLHQFDLISVNRNLEVYLILSILLAISIDQHIESFTILRRPILVDM